MIKVFQKVGESPKKGDDTASALLIVSNAAEVDLSVQLGEE